MSGVVALVDRGRGGVDRDSFRAMLDRIDHRGPDGSGSWVDGHVALGHQQLASTPQARFDEQPVRDDELVLVGDARLDNRGELQRSLRAPVDKDSPDSQFLLAAYRRWGERCPEKLVGAFAFAVWDADAGRLFCARDHFGVKPLYYYRDEDLFAAGSELKSLLAHPAVHGGVDETKIGDFLVGRFGDTENTYYESISRLPPAHRLTVQTDGYDRQQYWDLDPTQTVRLGSDAAYERRFRELFDQAVSCRLRTTQTVGTTLSGGLDSSSVTVTARELMATESDLHTFSNVFEEAPSSDEREYVEAVVDRPGITPHFVFLDDVRTIPDVERIRAHFDKPPHNPMHFGIWEGTKRAASNDVGVLLTGVMGDPVSSYGFGLLPDLFRTGHWIRLYRELRAMGDLYGAPTHRAFRQRVVEPLVPDRLTRTILSSREKPVGVDTENPYLSDDFIERTALRDRYERLYVDPSIRPRTARQRQHLSIKSGIFPVAFEISDLTNAAFGIDRRHPFTDKRLVEFALAMPASQQLSDGWSRSIVRRSLDDRLPEKVQWRVWKTAMNEAVRNAIRNDSDRLRSLVGDPGPIARYLDVERLDTAVENLNDPSDGTVTDVRALWRALSLSVWFERWGTDRT
jgi:asparagine synthase (glutamine-hydrolysing)